MRRHTIYVLSDAAGVCLYIGETWGWLGRRDGHMRKWWWPQVAHVQLVDVPDKRIALDLEASLIATLLPLYNAQQRTLPLPWTGDGPAPRIVASRIGNPEYGR